MRQNDSMLVISVVSQLEWRATSWKNRCTHCQLGDSPSHQGNRRFNLLLSSNSLFSHLPDWDRCSWSFQTFIDDEILLFNQRKWQIKNQRVDKNVLCTFLLWFLLKKQYLGITRSNIFKINGSVCVFRCTNK